MKAITAFCLISLYLKLCERHLQSEEAFIIRDSNPNEYFQVTVLMELWSSTAYAYVHMLEPDVPTVTFKPDSRA